MTRSILSNWFGLLVLAGSTALLTPVMIHHLGVVDYGVWVLASSCLDYYGLLDLGMRSAMFRYVALFRGGLLRTEVDRTFSSAVLLVTGTAILICALSVGVALFLPGHVSLQGASPRVLGWLLFLLGTSVAIMFPTRMLATYISAHQRWDLYNAAGIANTVTRSIVFIALLKLGYGILAIASATVVVAFLSLGQHIFFVLIADPQVRLNPGLITVSRIRELFGFSMRSLLVAAGDYLRFYSDSAVIACVLNVSLVAPFNVATRLIECFRSVVIAAGGPVLGAMTELDGSHRQKDLRELLLRSTRLLGLLSILGGVLLLVDGRSLLRLWVGQELVPAYPLVVILAVGYSINLAQHPTLLIVIAKGRHGPLGWWTIAEGMANIILSVIWGRSHGLIGVAMGTIVPMLIVKMIIQPRYALKAAEMTLWEYLRKGLGRPLVVGLLFFVAAGKVCSETTATQFAAKVGVQVILFLVCAWLFGLTRSERRWIWEYARRHLSSPVLRHAGELTPQSAEADLSMTSTCRSADEYDASVFPANLPQNTPELSGGDMRIIRPSALQCWEGENARKISVIIPTKNRADDLRRTLEDLVVQTRRPDEIIVVDQSSVPSFEPASVPIPVNYIYAPHISGAAVARNVAMDQATGDIWLFLDDDVRLEPEYVEEIVLAYSAEVAGVSGIITNYTVPSLSRRLFESVFVRGAFHDDRQPVYWHADALRFDGPQRVKQFGCGVMSFRSSVIRELRFDPQLTGCSLAEDIDFCARLPRGATLVIAPKARLFHKRSPTGRATAHWLDAHAQSSTYMRLRNWNRGFGDGVCFAWLQVGYGLMAVVGALKRASLEPFRAWARGAARGRSLALQQAKLASSGCPQETAA